MVEKEIKFKRVQQKIDEMHRNKYKLLRDQNPEFQDLTDEEL